MKAKEEWLSKKILQKKSKKSNERVMLLAIKHTNKNNENTGTTGIRLDRWYYSTLPKETVSYKNSIFYKGCVGNDWKGLFCKWCCDS